MSEHTKGRLDFCVNPGVMAYELVELARPTFVVATVPKLADARRLMAAWNACEGLTQDHFDGDWTAKGLSKHAKKYEDKAASLERELAAARALLREVSGDNADFVPRVISQELADRIRSYLNACDTPGSGHG